ncbi:hypothetical protein L7F22_057709 [Adiantum nelumboides]|nr:hypothetical protein [Adiantum nelumboides]
MSYKVTLVECKIRACTDLVEDCFNVIMAKFGLSVPLLGEGAGARGGYNSVNTSEQESRNQASLCKIESIRETVVALGLPSFVRDASEFQRKLNENPLCWDIIDKEADWVDTLVSIWEIIITQPAATLSSCGYDAKLLQQAAHYMRNFWQHEVSGWHMHPILSTLMPRISSFMHLLAIAVGTQLIAPPAELEAVTRIQSLSTKRIPLAELPVASLLESNQQKKMKTQNAGST